MDKCTEDIECDGETIAIIYIDGMETNTLALSIVESQKVSTHCMCMS